MSPAPDDPIPGLTKVVSITHCREAVAQSRARYEAHLAALATSAPDARPEWPRITRP